MSKHKRRDLSAEEQHVLEHGQIRLLSSPKDIARCDALINEHHYLHNVTLVGEHLRYAFVYKGQWLAVATWSSAAFHIKDRDQFIGWTPEQCRRRLPLLAKSVSENSAGPLFSRQRPDGEARRRRISSLDLRLRSNKARRPLARKPSGRRVFCPWPALARSLQPALGMLGPRRLGHSQNPSPQDPAQFSDTL